MPSTAMREIAILKELDHINIVKLLDVIYVPQQKRLDLVFEYLEYDMKKFMKTLKQPLNHEQIKYFMRQLLEGIIHCHNRRIIHRDLKPQNLLIDANSGMLKIADFGLARAFSIPIRTLTHEIETLWYRAPEVLLGQRQYSLGVDTWAIGCILYELYEKRPLFIGDSEIDQIFKIFQFWGTPSEEEWPGITQIPEYKPSFPRFKKINPYKAIKSMPQEAINLMLQLLTLDPTQRISSIDAIKHPYFNS